MKRRPGFAIGMASAAALQSRGETSHSQFIGRFLRDPAVHVVVWRRIPRTPVSSAAPAERTEHRPQRQPERHAA